MILLDGDAAPTANPTRWRSAVAWHAQRTPVSRETWDALGEAARQRAFTVSGVASASLLTDVHAAIERAVANGTTLADFKREVGARLEAEWGRPNAPRLETIFRTNVQTAYNAARHQEMSRPEVKAARPYWRFVAILDPRTSPVCRPLDQTLRPADDDFWQGHWPPLHYNCRSTVVSLSRRQAEREGGVTPVPEGEHVHPPAKGFGRTPDLAGESIEVTERAPAAVREVVEARPRPSAPTTTPAPASQPTSPGAPSRRPEFGPGAIEPGRSDTGTIDRSTGSNAKNTVRQLTKIEQDQAVDLAQNNPINQAVLAIRRTTIQQVDDMIRIVQDGTEDICLAVHNANTKEIKLSRWVHAEMPYGTYSADRQYVALGGENHIARCARNLTHEIGHALHAVWNKAEESMVEAYFGVANAGALTARAHISGYGKENHREFFAECYAAYVHEPEVLRKTNEGMYNLIERMLADRGIKP